MYVAARLSLANWIEVRAPIEWPTAAILPRRTVPASTR
jgi:hypothetical protein